MRFRKLAAYLAVGASLAACSDGGADVHIVSSYEATTFTVTPTGQAPINVLAAGGSLTINLMSDGTTTGALVVPAAANGGTAINESMAGTFTRVGDTVTFDQDADTFVRDMDFTVSGSTLTGLENFGGVTIAVTLTLQ